MEAIHARKISGEETDLELYDLICKNVGLSVYWKELYEISEP